MATLFHQSIIQFAPLRTFARFHTTTPYSQLIRELFPKALFDEQCVSYGLFIEIAWSFSSKATNTEYKRKWRVYPTTKHRIGGLPAAIYDYKAAKWYKDGKRHRDDKDPRTGLTLPAIMYPCRRYIWYKVGNHHRDDKDPRTGLTLPATARSGLQTWCKNGKYHRVDKDPQTGLTLPAVFYTSGLKEWYKDGKLYRDDKDPQTGLNLPAESHE